MSAGVQACPVPPRSELAALLHDADFADSYRFDDPQPEASALQSWLAVVARTPGWMNALMAMRNSAVQLVGLKHLGRLQGRTLKPAEAYRIGDRLGIFSLHHLAADEIVLGDDDRHLRVRVSLRKERQPDGRATVALSTVVHIHNRLGRLYMAVVGPVHGVIVPLMLRQAVARPA